MSDTLNTLVPNPNIPQTPTPVANLPGLTYCVQALKQGMDSLAGYRGQITNRAVTFTDLVNAGLLATPTTATVNPYFVSNFSGTGVLTTSQVLFVHRFPMQVVFPVNFGALPINAASAAGSMVNATATPALSIQKCPSASDPTTSGNWAQVGTATFAAGGHAATLSTSSLVVVFASGDFLRVVAPATADATLAQVYFSLTGKR